MESAAGIGGLIKTVLALEHEEIPRHRNLERLNPHIEWDRIAVRVVMEPVRWPRGEKRRVAGVSAFGFSGTNAHVVLEEGPGEAERAAEAAEGSLHILRLSAKTDEAVRALAGRYVAHLGNIRSSASGMCVTRRRWGGSSMRSVWR